MAKSWIDKNIEAKQKVTESIEDWDSVYNQIINDEINPTCSRFAMKKFCDAHKNFFSIHEKEFDAKSKYSWNDKEKQFLNKYVLWFDKYLKQLEKNNHE